LAQNSRNNGAGGKSNVQRKSTINKTARKKTQVNSTQQTRKSRPQNPPNSNIKQKTPRRDFDKPFFILVLTLMVIGTVMMFSASYYFGIYESGDGLIYVKKQLGISAVGLLAMFVISYVDYHKLKNVKFVYFVFLGSLVMLAYTSFKGIKHNGARRWLKIGIEFQPSEVMKFAVVLLFSYIISVNYKKMKTLKYGIVPFFLVLGLVAGLMMKQPHLSGTILICSIGIVMIFVGGSNIKHLVITGIIAIGGLTSFVFYAMMTGKIAYFAARFQSWRHPFSDVGKNTWQTCQSLIAIGSGGIFGMGFGNSRQKFLYLPESKNDFVFAIVCEELGLIGAVLVIILFSLFIFRGFYIASRSEDKFGMMLAVGLTIQIGIQALLNIAVVTNTIPNTGISLPFFSYGGTALAMQLAQMGIILNISRQAVLEE